MPKKVPAWQKMAQDGLVASLREAEGLILSGKVRQGDTPITTPGQPVDPARPLTVRGLADPFVAKGGLKLRGALDAFGISVAGIACIDAGASTGGFTDCLVKSGAAPVYAVDVGYGQLAGSLRQNPAVVNLEKTNIGDEKLLSLSPRPAFATVDLSYLSLTKAVPLFSAILHGQGEMLCLVKPLFETDDAAARRIGELPDTAYLPLLLRLMDDLTATGASILGVTHSTVTGNSGTLEFFLRVAARAGQSTAKETLAREAEAAVEAALGLPRYRKG